MVSADGPSRAGPMSERVVKLWNKVREYDNKQIEELTLVQDLPRMMPAPA
jgi:hypothetical protein